MTDDTVTGPADVVYVGCGLATVTFMADSECVEVGTNDIVVMVVLGMAGAAVEQGVGGLSFIVISLMGQGITYIK